MHKLLRPLAAASAAVLMLSLPAMGQSGGDAQDRMDPRQMAEQLSAFGMFELLEAYTAGLDDPSEARYLLARAKIARAAAENLDPKERDRLLDEAIAVLQQLAGATEGATEPKKVLEHFRLTLELVEAGGLVRAKPYAMRLMYLQGGRADREALIQLTSQIVQQLVRMNRQLEDTLMDWRADLKLLVTVLPELEALQESARYKSAWIRFYRASALPEGSEKSPLLNDALIDAEKYAAGDAGSGVKYWSLLLAGMCARELKDHPRAAETLAAADVDAAGAGVRTQATFEAARNLIEADKFDEASQAVDRFGRESLRLLGKPGELEVDVKTAMLRNYLQDQWAAAEADPQAAVKHAKAAQQVLLDFLAKYEGSPEVKAAFLEIFATKYRDREDYDNLNSMILLSVASFERTQATDASLAKAEKLLRMVLQRDDEISKEVKADALWELALILNDRRQNLDAGRLFVQLAQEYPNHRLALQAARNAVISFNGIIQTRRAGRLLIARNLHEEFIKALEALLGKWGGQGDLAKWNFDLGWQRQQLAGDDEYDLMAKAVAAYDKVPASLPESMEARRLALELRVRLLDGPEPLRGDAQSLVAMLDRYAQEAKTAAATATDKDEAKRLRDGGAQVAFQAVKLRYEKLAQTDTALQQLRRLPEEWPDTEVLPAVWEFEISKLVEQEKTAEAIEKVEAFGKKYPQRAESLLQLVVRQIQRRIEELRDAPDKAQELKTYQAVFDRFAGELYASALQKNLPPGELYPVQQMRAEALLEGGKPAEAIKLFETCAAYDAQRRKALEDAIEKETSARLEAVRGTAGNVGRTMQLTEEFFQAIKTDGWQVESFSDTVDLRKAADYLAQSNTSQQQTERLEVLTDALARSIRTVGEARKRALPVDARNVLGLARSHRALGQVEQAIERYGQLVEGVNKAEYPALYWSYQLERARCMLDAFRRQVEQLKRLRILIRQLRQQDPEMGGLYDQFNAVEAEVDRLTR